MANVLFVCRHNADRSQISEALLASISATRRVKELLTELDAN